MIKPKENEFVERAKAFTARVGPQAVLLLVGSRAAGLADSWSDLDLWVIGDKRFLSTAERTQYDRDTQLFVDRGDCEAHWTFYDLHDLQTILDGYPDEKMWIVMTAQVLSGAAGTAVALKRHCEQYPQAAVEPKLKLHFGHYWRSLGPLNTAARGMPETALLCVGQTIEHLCKLCFLAERKPYPYAKWLVPVSRGTALGRKTAPFVSEAVFGIDEFLHPPAGRHFRELVPLKKLRQTKDMVRNGLKELGWNGSWIDYPDEAVAETLREHDIRARSTP